MTLEPGARLTNYDVDTLAQIQARGLGLVFRAASSNDYQVAKLLVEGSGPFRSLALERYAVIAGRALRPVRVQYHEHFQGDTLYHVHLQVLGNTFSLYVQGNLVDYWSDARLASGGVGLFCSPGEHARVAWIRVAHNTDALGKACSWVLSLLPKPS